MTEQEKETVVNLMEIGVGFVSKPGWPNVKVLERIKSARCLAILREWAFHAPADLGASALGALIRLGQVDAGEIQRLILKWLPEANIGNGMVAVHRLAKLYKSEAILTAAALCASNSTDSEVRWGCGELVTLLSSRTLK